MMKTVEGEIRGEVREAEGRVPHQREARHGPRIDIVLDRAERSHIRPDIEDFHAGAALQQRHERRGCSLAHEMTRAVREQGSSASSENLALDQSGSEAIPIGGRIGAIPVDRRLAKQDSELTRLRLR